MDDIRASIGCVQMKKLQEDLIKNVLVSRQRYVEKLSQLDKIIVPFADHQRVPVSNYIMPIVI
ncbi:MAG: hypothetical protein V8R91_05100 [Butyricimonas faecihominis]